VNASSTPDRAQLRELLAALHRTVDRLAQVSDDLGVLVDDLRADEAALGEAVQ
jgi:hypothetical protein